VHIEKAPIPKGQTYPLKSSALDDALAKVGVTPETHLIMRPSKIFLDAHFWPPNPRIAHERLYVRVGTVKSSESRAAREFMAAGALPSLIEWLQELLALPERSPSRSVEHYFRQEWDGVA